VEISANYLGFGEIIAKYHGIFTDTLVFKPAKWLFCFEKNRCAQRNMRGIIMRKKSL
jgi:hypothetical protein